MPNATSSNAYAGPCEKCRKPVDARKGQSIPVRGKDGTKLILVCSKCTLVSAPTDDVHSGFQEVKA